MSYINVIRRAQAQAIAPQSNKVSVSDAHVAGNAYYTAICSNGCKPPVMPVIES